MGNKKKLSAGNWFVIIIALIMFGLIIQGIVTGNGTIINFGKKAKADTTMIESTPTIIDSVIGQ